jgi:DNA-binding MarR family transcriptional regulator
MTSVSADYPSRDLFKILFSDYSQRMKKSQINSVRRFNRAVTQRIGALDDAYLSRGRSLGLSRLLWEIEPAGSEVRLLRARLGLDSGYFSRQLRRLEADRLVTTDPDDGDGRVRKVRLTRKGLAERAILDSSSNALAASILTPLTQPQRDRLVAAMADVERLMLASQVRIEIIDPRDIDARYCLRSYFEELGRRFDTGFDPAQSISASDEEMTLPNGLLLAANLLGAAVGCGALMTCAALGWGDVCWNDCRRRPRRGEWRSCDWRLTARSLKQSIFTRKLGSSRWNPSITNRMRTIGSRKISAASNSATYAGQAPTRNVMSHRNLMI